MEEQLPFVTRSRPGHLGAGPPSGTGRSNHSHNGNTACSRYATHPKRVRRGPESTTTRSTKPTSPRLPRERRRGTQSGAIPSSYTGEPRTWPRESALLELSWGYGSMIAATAPGLRTLRARRGALASTTSPSAGRSSGAGPGSWPLCSPRSRARRWPDRLCRWAPGPSHLRPSCPLGESGDLAEPMEHAQRVVRGGPFFGATTRLSQIGL